MFGHCERLQLLIVEAHVWGFLHLTEHPISPSNVFATGRTPVPGVQGKAGPPHISISDCLYTDVAWDTLTNDRWKELDNAHNSMGGFCK